MKNILPAIIVAAALVVVALVAFQPSATVAQSSQTVASNVAVIDLDALAQKIGRAAKLNEAVKAKQDELNTQLNDAQQQLNTQMQAKEQEFGPSPTAEQAQQLQQLRGQASVKLIQARQQAKQILQQHQNQVINEFREEVKPHAQAVAKDKGYLVVLVKNDQLVYTYASSVDITDAVAAKMGQ